MHIKNCETPIFFLCLFYARLFSQNPGDPINISLVNEKYLEYLIKEKIDSVRIQHKLSPLFNDSILYVASKFHAKYLFEKRELSHTEPENPKTETPQKRAEFFGAVNYLVGENVVFTLVGKPVKGKSSSAHINSTYDDVATDIVSAWVHSPGHYKNIITPAYNSTGLSIWVDPVTSRIYSVQKFAKRLYEYDFIENKQMFPYSNYKSPHVVTSFNEVEAKLHKGKHAFKIKQPKLPACQSCNANANSMAFMGTSLKIENGTIVMSSYEAAPFFNMLKKRKDGFAVEIVVYEPFDCGNPQYYTNQSRRSKQCIFNGTVLKPIYKRDALKGFKPGGKKRKQIQKRLDAGKVKKYELKLGKVSKSITSYYEVNLLLIQKKRLCRVKHFSSFCGDTLEYFYPLSYIHDTVSNAADVCYENKTLTFVVPFEKNKTEYKLSDITSLSDSLFSPSFITDSATIHAYSSVEGDEDLNKKLQQKRAENIIKVIESNQTLAIHKTITSEENWTLFEEQIKKANELKIFEGLTHEQIKTKLQDTLLQKKCEKFLNAQRKAKIQLKGHEIIDDRNIEKYILSKVTGLKKRYNKLKYAEGNDERKNEIIDSLNLYMGLAYNKIKEGVIAEKFFQKFDIDDENKYQQYKLNRLSYEVQITGVKMGDVEWLRDVYSDVVSLYNEGQKSFFIIYNMLNFIQQHGKDMQVVISETAEAEYINELRIYVKTEAEKDLADKIAMNYNFRVGRMPVYTLTGTQRVLVELALKDIYDYFSKKTLEQNELNRLAAYFTYHGKSDWVVALLWPQYEKRINNVEGLSLLAKVLYQNYEESGNAVYYNFLKDLYSILGGENWCPMFVGPCNISFQAFDYELFRNFYCEKCHEYMNYAKDPKNRTGK